MQRIFHSTRVQFVSLAEPLRIARIVLHPVGVDRAFQVRPLGRAVDHPADRVRGAKACGTTMEIIQRLTAVELSLCSYFDSS